MTSTPSPSERARRSWAALTPEERAARLAPAVRANKIRGAEAYIRRLVESAPPLSDEQRARLAAILRPGKES